jgi:hypothetical protein
MEDLPMIQRQSNPYNADFVQFIASFALQYHVTLSFNRRLLTDVTWAYDRLRHLIARVDHHFLGHNWARAPKPTRTQYCAVPEGRRVGNRLDGLHYHLLLTPAPGARSPIDEQHLRTFTAEAWSACAPSGDVCSFCQLRLIVSALHPI